jgi:hypothetical protein
MDHVAIWLQCKDRKCPERGQRVITEDQGAVRHAPAFCVVMLFTATTRTGSEASRPRAVDLSSSTSDSLVQSQSTEHTVF